MDFPIFRNLLLCGPVTGNFDRISSRGSLAGLLRYFQEAAAITLDADSSTRMSARKDDRSAVFENFYFARKLVPVWRRGRLNHDNIKSNGNDACRRYLRRKIEALVQEPKWHVISKGFQFSKVHYSY